MKKIVIIMVVALLGFATAFGQVPEEGVQLTLVDSTVLPRETKVQFTFEQISRMFLPSLLSITQREKQERDSVVNFEETKALYIAVNEAVMDYYNKLFITVETHYTMYPSDYAIQGSIQTGNVFGYDYYLNGDTLQYGIIRQFDEAQIKIDEAKANPDLDYIGGTKLVAELELEKKKLVDTFDQLEAIKPQ